MTQSKTRARRTAAPAALGNLVTDENGDCFTPPPGFECVGMHLGPRTKFTHPYNYDPLLQYATGLTPDGSAYSDRFSGWYESSVLRDLMTKHFGKEGDYYYSRSPQQIQAFLRELFNKPNLVLTRIEEQCNQASGYPVWFFAFQSGEPAEAPVAAAAA